MIDSISLPHIVLASKNAHKLSELQDIFGFPVGTITLATEYPNAPDVEENGDTFKANALIKAQALAGFTGEWALADDSGLEVKALNWEPGIYSARYAGEHGNDAANNALLVERLQNVPEPRIARFTCAIALVSPDGRSFVVEGHCYGQIVLEPRGANGFGYDPHFIPDGYKNTFAELDSNLKCQISHRAVAAELMRQIMLETFHADTH